MGSEPELPAYQALLALEKGTSGSPIEQLTEAARVVGVDFEDYDLDLFADDGELPSITPAHSAPKEEWVLRWLLKKLKGPTDISTEYRNNGRSWILLRILFMRIPIRSLAFTLSENDFLGLLRDSLVGLDFSSGQASPYDQVEYNSKPGSLLKRKLDSDSSKQIRKRTRTDEPIANTKPEEESSHYDTFLAIIESVNALIKLTEQIPQSKDVLKAQLKLVLRGSAETSAIIIGRACNYAQSTLGRMNAVAATSFPHRLHTPLVSVLEIWTLRSDHHENGSTASSNDIFVSHALVGALGLIRIARQFSNDLELVNGLERLVALHVVLSFREVFFSSAAADTKNESSSKSAQRLSHEFDTKSSPVLSGADAIILPTLFDISIRSMPRNNFRRQVHETPWLESFLILLVSQAGYPLEEDREMRDVTLLQEFLDVAIHRKLKLSLITLVQIASKFSGLSGTQDGIEWSLIARILRLDVDVFLLNSGVEQSVALLNSLLAGITAFPLQNELASGDLHDLIKHEIIIPLARGFFNARDGPAFIKLWAEQIAESESSRHLTKKQDLISIWESDDVVKACGQCLASSDTQLDEQIGDLLKRICLIKLSGDNLPGAYSSLVVLDSLLMSPIKSGLDAISISRYEQILEELSNTFSSTRTEVCWKWRIWRCLQNSVSRYPACSELIQFDVRHSLVPLALRKIEFFAQNPKVAPTQDCLETFWSYNFVLSLGSRASGTDFNDYVDKSTHNTLSSFKDLLKSSFATWNGQAGDLSTPVAIVIACITALLGNIQNLASLTSDTRQLLFTNLLVSLENEPTSTASIQLSQIWKDFLCFGSGMELTAIVDDLVKVAYDRLTNQRNPSRVLISSLLYIPTRLVSRSQRGLIIDTLHSFLLSGEIGLEMKVDILLLMTRLVESARSSAQILDDPDKIWEISRSISMDGGCDTQLLFDTFTKLYEAITVRFEAAPQDSVTKFLNTAYSRTTENLPIRSYQTMEYPLFILSLSHLHKREHQLGEKRFQTICTLRHKVFNDLISGLHTLTKSMKKTYEGTDTASLIGILCALDNFQDLRRESKDSRKKLRKLEEYTSKYNLPMSVRKQLKLLSLASKAPSADFESRLHDCMTLFPFGQLHGKDQRSLIHRIQAQISEMEEDVVVKMIHNMCEADLSGEENGYRLLLLGISVIRMSPVQDRDSTASTEISTAFTKVSTALAHNGSIESFCLAAEALDIILRTQSRSVTQWNIDNLLANICLIVSPSGPPIDAKFAGTIHTRLCKLLGTLFTLYRQKLSGRFHLVLPVMQALLRCLFTYNQKSSNSSGAVLARPPWIEGSHHMEPRHGTQFSRLLSSLCDPTVSSVQRPGGVGHSKQALNDNTKKVKSLAGQYLQYLVMEYTSCQLKGHIPPEMKAALMPGMYVILDVMSQSTMRAMNAGMDSSSRAVFKTLYDDYIRFGKWDHN
ncbi:conserved hypothetical protein [Trichophyton verrucosum HKI 0517]|uniref:Nucleolar 27S pre-rRNA processing Urb2/Npa2 C-terminal domain-containing protein n=1 Tax=Trichophyton verrucosum (strain HKI 0517) TaxID=663202 RepID=D4DG61_TRIVH|nr:uncharacterized protein TRV_06163 [Trichophyton verrucosum HKI 0517]EFE39162.1 conserved hypothetical protein [Trichophyton verrucosum HKI 0517]